VPEGDTIWRVAARLRPALVGAELVRFAAPRLTGPVPAVGVTVDAVDAVGKHLLIRFGDGVVVQTHLRMTGSWHLYRPGDRWARPRHQARLEIETASWLAVCFLAPVVRSTREPVQPPVPGTPTVGPAGVASRPGAVAHLGPDLTGPAPDLGAVLARLGAEPGDRPLVDVLLDQRVAAGIGNVYKSELLWLHRLAPLAPLGSIDAEARRALYGDAARLLRANLGPGARVTVPGVPGGLAVYGRAGRACPRCRDVVRRATLGSPPRGTWWCPGCQLSPAPAD
jgi:endonuclease-8